MAKVVETEVDSRIIIESFPVVKVLALGVFSGILFFIISFLFERYLLRASSCIDGSVSCGESIRVAGDIASIVVALFGVIFMIKLRMIQPLIVAVTTAAVLWGLASWTFGLPLWEVIGWSLITYVVSYLLFSWVVRYDRLWPVLISILIIVMIIRVLVNA
jgi:hypothetical protein